MNYTMNPQNSKTELPSQPLVTIITVVFNGAQFLEQTIRSILQQTYKNIEYIVIDGGSTDGTLDIIKRYDANITRWISEKDRGTYDAINKGLDMATGDLIGLLHEGSRYTPKCIETAAALFLQSDSDEVIVAGSINWIYPKKKPGIRSQVKPLHPGNPSVWHESLFISSELTRKNGRYDLQYKICADNDYVARAISANNAAVVYSDAIFVEYLTDWRQAGQFVKLRESYLIQNKYLGTPFALKNAARRLTMMPLSILLKKYKAIKAKKLI